MSQEPNIRFIFTAKIIFNYIQHILRRWPQMMSVATFYGKNKFKKNKFWIECLFIRKSYLVWERNFVKRNFPKYEGLFFPDISTKITWNLLPFALGEGFDFPACLKRKYATQFKPWLRQVWLWFIWCFCSKILSKTKIASC